MLSNFPLNCNRVPDTSFSTVKKMTHSLPLNQLILPYKLQYQIFLGTGKHTIHYFFDTPSVK